MATDNEASAVRSTGRLVVVAKAGSLYEADVVRATLDAEDIEAAIKDENAVNTMPHMQYAIAPYGVGVMVHEEDAQRAQHVLQGHPSIDIDAPHVPDEPQPETPDQLARHALVMAIIALCFLPLLFGAIYYATKAVSLARTQPPATPRTYRRTMRHAMFFLIFDLIIYIWVGAMLLK